MGHSFLADWNGISLLYDAEWEQSHKIELYTDACGTGYGGYYQGAWIAGAWSPDILAAAHARRKRISMPFLELHALVYAAATWGPSWKGRKIVFWCDCLPVVHAVTSGNSKQPQMMHLLRELITLACNHNFDFRCQHIPGVSNVIADTLSRDGDCPKFRALCPEAQQHGCTPPHIALPPPLQAPPVSVRPPRRA